MFDNILRELEKIERGGTLSIPIYLPLDDEGYFDRKCPSELCRAEFKVVFDDWEAKVSDERVYCPLCRAEAEATEWNTPEQEEYIKQVALSHLSGIINDALARDAREFNRRQSAGFISLSMTYKPGAPTVVVPIGAAEALRQKFTCETCKCRYSSLGAAFFCPACGHNSAESMFAQTVETVRKSLAALPAIREAVRTAADPDTAENTVREILENSMGRLVGAFQRVAEVLFERAPGTAVVRRRKNVFQNLAESSGLWRVAVGKGYEDLLTPSDMADLLRLFQQRHLLAHCEGIVDQDYINKSGDSEYVVGQRLVIREQMVARLAELVVKLTTELHRLA